MTPYNKYKVMMESGSKGNSRGKSRNMVPMTNKRKAIISAYSNIMQKKKQFNFNIKVGFVH